MGLLSAVEGSSPPNTLQKPLKFEKLRFLLHTDASEFSREVVAMLVEYGVATGTVSGGSVGYGGGMPYFNSLDPTTMMFAGAVVLFLFWLFVVR